MKKTVISLILVISCVLLCSCGSAANATTKSSSSAQTSTTAAETDAVTAATAEVGQSDAAGIIRDIATVQAFTENAVAEEDIESIVMAGINAPSSMNGQPWHFTVVTDEDTLQQIASDMSFVSGSRPVGASAPDGASSPEGAVLPEGMTKPEGVTVPEGMTKPEGVTAPEGMTKPEGAAPASPTASGTAKAGIADAPLVIIISCKAGSELDAGLATQNMSAEAQLLGYGTKIISSPKMALNGSKQAEYKELLGIPEDMTAVCMLLIGTADTESYDAVTGATARNAASDVVTYLK